MAAGLCGFLAVDSGAQELEPYIDASIAFSRPAGWQVIEHESERFLIVRQDPERGTGSPEILLQILPLGPRLDPEAIRLWLNQHFGGTFRMETHTVSPTGAGAMAVYEKSRPPIRIAVLLEPRKTARYTVFGLFIAPRADFITFGGEALLARVVGSVLAQR